MAAVTSLGNTFNTNSGTHTVTATPAIGDLIVIIRGATGNTTSTAPTDNNSSGTYTLVKQAVKNATTDPIEVWVRKTFITAASSTIFTEAPGASTGGGLIVLKITGMSKVDLGAIRSSGGQNNQAAGGTPAPVLSNTPLTGNPIITAVFNATSPAGVTVRTGYAAADANVGYAIPTTGFTSTHLNSGETSATITWGGTSASAFCSLAIELDSSAAAFSTFSDTFTGATIDLTKWYNTFGTIAQNNVITITEALNSTAYGGMDSLNKYDLTGSYAFVQVTDAGTQSNANWEVFPIQLILDVNNKLKWYINNNQITAITLIANVQTLHNATSYNSSTMKYFKIREAGGTTFWDYSADGLSWTNLYSVANPFAVTSLYQEFSAGCFVASAATSASLDNFNVTPSAAQYVSSLATLGVG